MTTLDAISILLEVLTWVGLIPGLALLIAGLIPLGAASRWITSTGVVVEGKPDVDTYRYFDTDGDVHTGREPLESTARTVGDDLTVYYLPRKPWISRLDNPRGQGRALRILGCVLLGIGLVSSIVSIVLLFVE